MVYTLTLTSFLGLGFRVAYFELKRRRIQLDDEKVKSLECLKFQSYVQP